MIEPDFEELNARLEAAAQDSNDVKEEIDAWVDSLGQDVRRAIHASSDYMIVQLRETTRKRLAAEEARFSSKKKRSRKA